MNVFEYAFWHRPIFSTAPAASRYTTPFKVKQKWQKNYFLDYSTEVKPKFMMLKLDIFCIIPSAYFWTN